MGWDGLGCITFWSMSVRARMASAQSIPTKVLVRVGGSRLDCSSVGGGWIRLRLCWMGLVTALGGPLHTVDVILERVTAS